MKQRGVFLIGLILITVYNFLFPRPSGKELIISPDHLTVLKPVPAPADPSFVPALAVVSGNKAGYLDEHHELQAFFSSGMMAVDQSWIAVSGDNGLSLMEPGGRLIARIPDSAYPVARNGNLFLYRNNTGVLSKIDPSNGRILWRREYISEITVLDGCPGKTLVGLLDGRVELIGDTGEILLEYRPGGSRIEAVYGGTLSSDGSRIALISGLDPQRFILLEERKNGYRPVTHHDTGTDFRRSVAMQFVRNDNRVLYENNGFIDAVNLNGYTVIPLDFSERLVNGIDNPVDHTLLLFGRSSGRASMKILSRYDLSMFESRLPVETTRIVRDRNYAVIVDGNTIAVLELSVR